MTPPRWAVSPLDEAHLLCDGDQPSGELRTRCGGVVLPADAPVHDYPAGRRVCHPCKVIFRADLDHSPPGQGRPVKWALSVEDWHSHAVDERAEHPTGVYRAECGHLLQTVVTLHDEHLGVPCGVCATLQLDVVQATLDRAAAALQQLAQSDPGRPSV